MSAEKITFIGMTTAILFVLNETDEKRRKTQNDRKRREI